MLKLEHIAWELPDGEEIIRDIDLTVGNQKMVVVTGPNGGGKTTLAKLIAGIKTPASGRILLDGEDITEADVTERAKRELPTRSSSRLNSKDLPSGICWNWLPAESWITMGSADC